MRWRHCSLCVYAVVIGCCLALCLGTPGIITIFGCSSAWDYFSDDAEAPDVSSVRYVSSSTSSTEMRVEPTKRKKHHQQSETSEYCHDDHPL